MAIYSNLSLFYANELQKLAQILGHPIETLNIVGGGSNVALMNQLTSTLSGVQVIAGPSEATAIGNILVQMITTNQLPNIEAGRQLIAKSFNLKIYQPESNHYAKTLKAYQAYLAGSSEGDD